MGIKWNPMLKHSLNFRRSLSCDLPFLRFAHCHCYYLNPPKEASRLFLYTTVQNPVMGIWISQVSCISIGERGHAVAIIHIKTFGALSWSSSLIWILRVIWWQISGPIRKTSWYDMGSCTLILLCIGPTAFPPPRIGWFLAQHFKRFEGSVIPGW